MSGSSAATKDASTSVLSGHVVQLLALLAGTLLVLRQHWSVETSAFDDVHILDDYAASRYHFSGKIKSEADKKSLKFSEENVLRLVERVLECGPYRSVGSHANEVCAVKVLTEELKAMIPPALLEVEVQSTDEGSYWIDFLGGVVHSYDKLTNVVAKLKL